MENGPNYAMAEKSAIAERQAAECHREMIFGTLKDQRGSRGRDA